MRKLLYQSDLLAIQTMVFLSELPLSRYYVVMSSIFVVTSELLQKVTKKKQEPEPDHNSNSNNDSKRLLKIENNSSLNDKCTIKDYHFYSREKCNAEDTPIFMAGVDSLHSTIQIYIVF